MQILSHQKAYKNNFYTIWLRVFHNLLLLFILFILFISDAVIEFALYSYLNKTCTYKLYYRCHMMEWIQTSLVNVLKKAIQGTIHTLALTAQMRVMSKYQLHCLKREYYSFKNHN